MQERIIHKVKKSIKVKILKFLCRFLDIYKLSLAPQDITLSSYVLLL